MYPYLITVYGLGFGKSRTLVWRNLLLTTAAQLALMGCSVWSWFVSRALESLLADGANPVQGHKTWIGEK